MRGSGCGMSWPPQSLTGGANPKRKKFAKECARGVRTRVLALRGKGAVPLRWRSICDRSASRLFFRWFRCTVETENEIQLTPVTAEAEKPSAMTTIWWRRGCVQLCLRVLEGCRTRACLRSVEQRLGELAVVTMAAPRRASVREIGRAHV